MNFAGKGKQNFIFAGFLLRLLYHIGDEKSVHGWWMLQNVFSFLHLKSGYDIVISCKTEYRAIGSWRKTGFYTRPKEQHSQVPRVSGKTASGSHSGDIWIFQRPKVQGVFLTESLRQKDRVCVLFRQLSCREQLAFLQEYPLGYSCFIIFQRRKEKWMRY